jgi:hypothetical protein
MGYSSYDADPRLARQMYDFAPTATGLSVPGTAASDTVLLRVPFSDAISISGSARVRLTTGGTAAGPNVTFGKSLAGTGASVAFGTFVSGTAANGVASWVALATTSFAAGDELVLTNVAGTAAATPVMIFSLGYNTLLV